MSENVRATADFNLEACVAEYRNKLYPRHFLGLFKSRLLKKKSYTINIPDTFIGKYGVSTVSQALEDFWNSRGYNVDIRGLYFNSTSRIEKAGDNL